MTWLAASLTSGKMAIPSVMRRTGHLRHLGYEHDRLSLKPLSTTFRPRQVTRFCPRVRPFAPVGRVWTWLAIGREFGRNECPVDHMVSLLARPALRGGHPCGGFAMGTHLLATFPVVPRYILATRLTSVGRRTSHSRDGLRGTRHVGALHGASARL